MNGTSRDIRVRLHLKKVGRRFEVLSVENNRKVSGYNKAKVKVGDKLVEGTVVLFQMNPHRFDIKIDFPKKG